MSNPNPTELTALHAVARAALRHRDRTGTQGVLSEALDRLTASGWRPDGPESEEALAGLLGALGWQPIDTAPRKNSALLWFPFGKTFSNGISGCMFVGIWTYGPTGASDEEVLSWRDPGDFESLGNPTHWMPLPDPPAISPDAANTQSSDKEKLADWMAANDFDTGRDDTMDQLLDELDGHVLELRARAPVPAEQPRCWPWRHLWQVTGQTVDRGWYGATHTTVLLRCARCGVRRREY